MVLSLASAAYCLISTGQTLLCDPVTVTIGPYDPEVGCFVLLCIGSPVGSPLVIGLGLAGARLASVGSCR